MLPLLLMLLMPLVVLLLLLPEGWQWGEGEGRWKQSSFVTGSALLLLNRGLGKGRATRCRKSSSPGWCKGGDAVHVEEQGWDDQGKGKRQEASHGFQRVMESPPSSPSSQVHGELSWCSMATLGFHLRVGGTRVSMVCARIRLSMRKRAHALCIEMSDERLFFPHPSWSGGSKHFFGQTHAQYITHADTGRAYTRPARRAFIGDMVCAGGGSTATRWPLLHLPTPLSLLMAAPSLAVPNKSKPPSLHALHSLHDSRSYEWWA